jgi:putative Mn2+ efflux pump MntP
MKAKLLAGFVLFLCSQTGQALACSVCYGAKDGKTTEHMAVAIWVLMGVVMSVMGGVGAFSFHLWRHANTPLEPHQELTDEDLDRYE